MPWGDLRDKSAIEIFDILSCRNIIVIVISCFSLASSTGKTQQKLGEVLVLANRSEICKFGYTTS